MCKLRRCNLNWSITYIERKIVRWIDRHIPSDIPLVCINLIPPQICTQIRAFTLISKVIGKLK